LNTQGEPVEHTHNRQWGWELDHMVYPMLIVCVLANMHSDLASKGQQKQIETTVE